MTGEVTIAFEAADSADAAWCLSRYYEELQQRFDNGFDGTQAALLDIATMSPPTGCLAVARLNASPVGCGALTTPAAGIGEVKRVWVSPLARGKGIAGKLMDYLEAEARNRGMTALRLDTNRNLQEARLMYVRRGYAEIAPYNTNTYADFWFEKWLG